MNGKHEAGHKLRAWRWIVAVLIALAIATVYAAWQSRTSKVQTVGFQPPEVALAQTTPKDVIGDLGGMVVRIPRHYAENVEYDKDPAFGEAPRASAQQRTATSQLRSFGMALRFPDMKGLESADLKNEYRQFRLHPDNPWISVSINAGEIYPSLGEKANDGLAKNLWTKSPYWFASYQRAPDMDAAGLEAYVVAGIDPRTGKPGRESDSTEDVYIHRTAQNHVATYISCGRTSVPGAIAACRMHFGLEPKAKVRVKTTFYPALMPKWRAIQTGVSELIYKFEVSNPQ